MRIAHVTYSFWPIRGGADAYLAELCRALAQDGHEQTVFQAQASPQGRLSAEVDVGPPGQTVRVAVVEWPADVRRSPGRRYWALAAQVSRHRGRILANDRIIAHYPHYALPLAGHPGLIGLSHGVTWDCDGASSRSAAARKALAQAAFRVTRACVANDTLFLREMGLPLAPGGPSGVEVARGRWFLPNAVDTARFTPDSAVPRDPVILLPRNLYRNRGILLGIAAFARLAERAPDLRLRIVGDEGDAGYREECETLARALKITSRVEFAGSVPWRVIPKEYRRAAVTWIPSLCGEGTSLSGLESMACGTPVVASNAGGLPDLPCLHADLTPDAFADATLRLLSRRDEIAHHQRDATLRGFSLAGWGDTWRRIVARP